VPLKRLASIIQKRTAPDDRYLTV